MMEREQYFATYERATRLANLAVRTVDLQHRRLGRAEPEDEDFILRQWSDFHFFIVALTRLRRSAMLAAKVPAITNSVRLAIKAFDEVLPSLKRMREVAEHFDDYAVDAGKDKNISRKALEVSLSKGADWEWLGYSMNIDQALAAGIKLFGALKGCLPLLRRGLH